MCNYVCVYISTDIEIKLIRSSYISCFYQRVTSVQFPTITHPPVSEILRINMFT